MFCNERYLPGGTGLLCTFGGSCRASWREERNKIYIGYTSNLIQRFYSHNIYSKSGYTVRYRPWIVLHTEAFDSKSDARKRELELKSGKGREWVWKIIESLNG